MIEYIAKVGGRYTYTDDFINLQNLALSTISIFSGSGSFIVSGCDFSKQSSGKYNVSPGYVWIDNKLRQFTGATEVSMDSGYYFLATYSIQSVKYAESATKDGRGIYGVRGQVAAPSVGDKYIYVTKDLLAPRIKDEFFGRYAILSNPTSVKQTIYKNLEISGDLAVSGEFSAATKNTLASPTDPKSRSFATQFSPSSLNMTQYYGQSIKNQIQFLDNGNIIFNIGSKKALEITSDGIVVDNILSGSTSGLSPDIDVSGNKINRVSGNTDTDSIDINYDGANKSTINFRNFNIYDGKRAKIATFAGIGHKLSVFGTISNESSDSTGLMLKNSLYGFSESNYVKLLSFTDKNNANGGKVGYELGSKDLSISNPLGGVVVNNSNFKVTGNISEGGKLLSEKYVSLQVIEDLRKSKQDAIAGMGLSQENFTTALKTKLVNISEYATGGDITTAIEGVLKKDQNLNDLADKSASRTNLGVMSAFDTSSTFAKVAGNLSDLVDKNQARINLSAAKVGDSYLKEEVYTKTDVFTKKECNDRFHNNLSDVPWTDCVRGASPGNFTIKARKIGDIVNIQGIINGDLNAGQLWFTLPNNIPGPNGPIGGVFWTEALNNYNNRSMSWKCDGGSRSFICRERNGVSGEQQLCITYFT